MQYILAIVTGFLIIQLSDILGRSKESEASPVKFNLVFFLKDTWQKLLLSLLLSFSIGLMIHQSVIIEDEVNSYELFGLKFDLLYLLYFVIGAVPEYILQILKKKYSFLQPDKVDGFERTS